MLDNMASVKNLAVLGTGPSVSAGPVNAWRVPSALVAFHGPSPEKLNGWGLEWMNRRGIRPTDWSNKYMPDLICILDTFTWVSARSSYSLGGPGTVFGVQENLLLHFVLGLLSTIHGTDWTPYRDRIMMEAKEVVRRPKLVGVEAVTPRPEGSQSTCELSMEA